MWQQAAASGDTASPQDRYSRLRSPASTPGGPAHLQSPQSAGPSPWQARPTRARRAKHDAGRQCLPCARSCIKLRCEWPGVLLQWLTVGGVVALQDNATTMAALTGALRREDNNQKECRRLQKELEALQVQPHSGNGCACPICLILPVVHMVLLPDMLARLVAGTSAGARCRSAAAEDGDQAQGGPHRAAGGEGPTCRHLPPTCTQLWYLASEQPTLTRTASLPLQQVAKRSDL